MHLDVPNHVSLSDSVGQAVAGCQLGKVAWYRVTGSVIARDMGIAPWFGMVCFGMVWASLHPPPPCRCRSTPRKCTAAEHDFIDTARQQIVALHGIPAAGVTRLLAIVSIPAAASGRPLSCPLWVKAREELTCRQNRGGRIHTLGRAVARG